LRIFLTAPKTADLSYDVKINRKRLRIQTLVAHVQYLIPIIFADFNNLAELENEPDHVFRTSYLRTFCDFYREYLKIINSAFGEIEFTLYDPKGKFKTLQYLGNVIRLGYMMEDEASIPHDYQLLEQLMLGPQ